MTDVTATSTTSTKTTRTTRTDDNNATISEPSVSATAHTTNATSLAPLNPHPMAEWVSEVSLDECPAIPVKARSRGLLALGSLLLLGRGRGGSGSGSGRKSSGGVHSVRFRVPNTLYYTPRFNRLFWTREWKDQLVALGIHWDYEYERGTLMLTSSSGSSSSGSSSSAYASTPSPLKSTPPQQRIQRATELTQAHLLAVMRRCAYQPPSPTQDHGHTVMLSEAVMRTLASSAAGRRRPESLLLAELGAQLAAKSQSQASQSQSQSQPQPQSQSQASRNEPSVATATATASMDQTHLLEAQMEALSLARASSYPGHPLLLKQQQQSELQSQSQQATATIQRSYSDTQLAAMRHKPTGRDGSSQRRPPQPPAATRPSSSSSISSQPHQDARSLNEHESHFRYQDPVAVVVAVGQQEKRPRSSVVESATTTTTTTTMTDKRHRDLAPPPTSSLEPSSQASKELLAERQHRQEQQELEWEYLRQQEVRKQQQQKEKQHKKQQLEKQPKQERPKQEKNHRPREAELPAVPHHQKTELPPLPREQAAEKIIQPSKHTPQQPSDRTMDVPVGKRARHRGVCESDDKEDSFKRRQSTKSDATTVPVPTAEKKPSTTKEHKKPPTTKDGLTLRTSVAALPGKCKRVNSQRSDDGVLPDIPVTKKPTLKRDTRPESTTIMLPPLMPPQSPAVETMPQYNQHQHPHQHQQQLHSIPAALHKKRTRSNGSEDGVMGFTQPAVNMASPLRWRR